MASKKDATVAPENLNKPRIPNVVERKSLKEVTSGNHALKSSKASPLDFSNFGSKGIQSLSVIDEISSRKANGQATALNSLRKSKNTENTDILSTLGQLYKEVTGSARTSGLKSTRNYTER